MSDNNNDEAPVSDGYVAIDITGGANKQKEQEEVVIEATLEEVTDNATEVVIEKEPVIEEKVVQEEEATEVVETKVVTPKTDKKPSRAKKRIKQLHTEKTDLQQRLDQAEQEKEQLMLQLHTGSKDAKASLKDSLESTITNLSKGMQAAMEDGDSSESVRLQEEMMNAKMQLAGVTSELVNIDRATEQAAEKAKTAPKKVQADVADVPEKALDWIEEYPQFNTDQLFYVSAMTINNQLIEEGFDDNSTEFYTELDERMGARFPEVFGTQEKTPVEYTEDKDSSSEDEDGKTKTSKKKPRKVEQTVSGGSRTPTSKSTKRGKGTVVLSPQDVKQAERWGLSLEQVARRVAHNETNTRTDGYVAIQIK